MMIDNVVVVSTPNLELCNLSGSNLKLSPVYFGDWIFLDYVILPLTFPPTYAMIIVIIAMLNQPIPITLSYSA